MTFSPMLALGAALALSLAGNGLLGRAYLGQRDATTSASAAAGQARDAARQCSDGVLALQAAAEKRASEAEAARTDAQRRQRAAQATAAELMARAPKSPADVCASAQAQIDDWLSTRGAR